ncbi:MAG TPA: crossover junction endodeoxyribonuclease RuvC [bacterium]|nr:crossover junction endodeoxyribonuclease RuvC [bacterium]HOL66255.1 crossover junction endodeoxyribonuclease RuvC [bacterium]HPP12897.1 crossover junction endodeoxyribonuclease RuvC [bacterium]
MTILGIDPAVNNLGYGVIEEERGALRVVTSGCLRPGSGKSFEEKLSFLCRELNALLDRVQPQKIAIEEIYLGKNAAVALKIGQIIGLVMGLSLIRKIPLRLIPVREVKQSLVGNGAAQKEQVKFMVERLTGLRQIATLDESDALAVAIACAFSREVG